LLLVLLFSFHCSPPYLPSFPTRRSSDLTLSVGTPSLLPLPAGLSFYILERIWSHEGGYPDLWRQSIWPPLPSLSPNHSLPEGSGWSVPRDRPLRFFV